MPLRERRPQMLSINVVGTNSASSSEGIRTPLPTTPFSYSYEHMPLAMTPDTPGFKLSPFEGLGVKVATDAEAEEEDVEWTDWEDGILQTYIARPATKAYPPGSLPPAEHLDKLTSEIMSTYARPTGPTRTLSHISSLAFTPSEINGGFTAEDLDMEMESSPTKKPFTFPQSQTPFRSSKVTTRSGWPHSWAATRSRLFQIARLESREAVGGHRRNNSESFVPVPEEKLRRPKLVVLGGQAMSRQQGSMDSIFGDGPPSIDTAMKLSSQLQGTAMYGDTEELHAMKGLFSPVKIEFGGKVDFAPPDDANTPTSTTPTRKTPPAFPPPKATARPSLLQRGRSYTNADIAHMSHSRNTSTCSDISLADGSSLGSPGSTETSPREGSQSSRQMSRSLSSPLEAFIFPKPSPVGSTFSISSHTSDHSSEPFTPFNQMSFPPSVHGLGPRVIGQQSPDSTPGSTPAITLTRTSPADSPGPSAYPSSQTTPRLGDSILGPALETDAETSLDFSRLSLNQHSSAESDAGSVSSSSTLTATATTSAPARRPLSLTRSMSELSPLAGQNPNRLPPSVSIPNNLSAQVRGFDSSGLESFAARETKRQRSTSGNSVKSGGAAHGQASTGPARSRFNPGLTVMVPQPLRLGDGLRSPFEHKPAGGSVLGP